MYCEKEKQKSDKTFVNKIKLKKKWLVVIKKSVENIGHETKFGHFLTTFFVREKSDKLLPKIFSLIINYPQLLFSLKKINYPQRMCFYSFLNQTKENIPVIFSNKTFFLIKLTESKTKKLLI